LDPLPEFLPGGVCLFVRGVEVVVQVTAFAPDELEVVVEMPVGGIGSQPGFYTGVVIGGCLAQQVFYQQVFMDAVRPSGVGM